MPQRPYGIDPGGPDGGIDPGSQADQNGKQDRARQQPPGEIEIIQGRHSLFDQEIIDHPVDQPADRPAQGQPGDAAQEPDGPDSKKKMALMSRFEAPTAFITPIS